MDAVEQAIAAAAQQAAATPAPTNTAVAVASPGGELAPSMGGTPLSMETLMMGSMSVDGWFKPKEFGLNVGDNPALVSTAKVMLDMTEGMGYISKMGIKGGNPAQYAYTTDMKTASGGGSWDAAQARIRTLDPKASPYRAVDLPMTILEEVFGSTPGAPEGTPKVSLAKPGQRLGYTTSTTNWANWETFYREVIAAGLKGKKVEVIIGAQRRVNPKGNVWGVMTFKLVGECVQDEGE